jgi:hypothetical protein
LHYEMRASTFADHMTTCNLAGACFITNDAPFPFSGSVSIRILNIVTGASTNQTHVAVALPTGPKLSHWFCAQDPPSANSADHSILNGDGEANDNDDDDDATTVTTAHTEPLLPPPPPLGSDGDYTMVLVSSNGFPEHGHVAFNHEAAAITTEADCLSSCLANQTTCRAVTWLPRPTEPCIHYQDVTGSIIKPSPGCHYYRLTGNSAAPYSVTPALPIDRNSFNKTLTGKAASLMGCEAACNTDPKCLGFTKYNRGESSPKSWRNDCWLYDTVPSLVANTMASWHQKPGTKPIPGPKPLPPTPPAPPPPSPGPTPSPPPPYPEPAQLNCTAWAHTSGWEKVGCHKSGGNCVLLINVYNSNSSSDNPESWSTLPFQPPKYMELVPAHVNWSIGQPHVDGRNHVTITLTSNATALYVVLTTAAQGRFSDNSLLLEGGIARRVEFLPWDGPMDDAKVALLRSTLRVEHLADNL